MAQQFKGKVIYAQEPKKGKNGWFMGFKIDSFNDFLNDFKPDKDILVKAKVGDIVSGTYENNGKYNVVQTFEKVGFSRPESPKVENAEISRTDFIQGDAISEKYMSIEFNTRLLNEIYTVFTNTDMYQAFKDHPGELQDLITSIFLAVRADLGRPRW